MNNVILYSVKTDASSPAIPEPFYQCKKCGNSSIKIQNNYCPNCGCWIDSFIMVRRREEI
jgi:hypothetical protein